MRSLAPAFHALAFTAVLAAAPIAAAQQQTVREIAPGETLRGSLAAGDRRGGDDTLYDLFRFTAEAGKIYVVQLNSDAFDPYLTITGPGGFNESDDDGGEGVNSRLEVRNPAGGTYEIRANSLEKADGAYFLSVAEVRSEGKAQPIAMGQDARGSLSATSPRYKEGAPYESYVFEGQAGARVSIEMKSDIFDTYLVLRRQGQTTELADDDDSAGDLNSRITFTLPETGAYEIIASTVDDGNTGPFTLALSDGSKRAKPETQPIAYGQVRVGELKDGDGIDEKDHLYDLYEFTGRAGDKLTIHLASDEFDPLLFLARADTGEVIADDDDGGEGELDSLIEVTLPANGAYRISAAAVEGTEGGPYMLGLSKAP